MDKRSDSSELTEQEVVQRLERALQRAVNMSPKPHNPDAPPREAPKRKAKG